jgi:hypothetical protein
MHVIPDIIPSLQPTVDLRVVFPEPPPKNVVLRARAKRRTLPIEAGVFLVNEQVNANTGASTKLGTERNMFRRAARQNYTRQSFIPSQDSIHYLWSIQVGGSFIPFSIA